mgnify:CR=1 FL=1
MEYTILILLLPLASFLVLGLAGMKMRPAVAGAVGTAVLAVVALGVPAVYFWTFFHSLSLQIKKMGLPRPFYRLLLDDEGLSVWMAGEQDKPEASRKYAWHDLHLAYRTPNAIYLYVRQNQAYLLNDSLDAAWSLLQASLPAERLHDMR